MWLALHDREDTILIRKAMLKPEIYGAPDDVIDGRSDWTALACHLEAIFGLIGRSPFLVIGMTSLLRGVTLSVFGPKLPANHLYYPDSPDPERSRPLSHILQNLRPGRAAEDCMQGRGRATGYHRVLLQQVTGRNYVTELTTPQDDLGGDRWFSWKDMFRARLEAGSDSREAIATVNAQSSFVDAMRAGRSASARKIGKRKWSFSPVCEEEDPEVESLKRKAAAQRKPGKVPKYMSVLKAVWAVVKESGSDDISRWQVMEQLQKDGHEWTMGSKDHNQSAQRCTKKGWLLIDGLGNWTLTESGRSMCSDSWG
ncbi:hypothetical protein WJX73_010364 [Symbiochloris irregularis]|uniref:Uncharacterized protein n=1 Tax=Symbiochloris irregularis TaxID=706552 RepID=A0AAW1PHX3_9CHLO